MGVPAELVGRQVRCPHCKQVLTAPAGGAPPAVPPPAPVVVPPPPEPELAPPAPEPELRAFNIPLRRESADSILSEPDESDDEVFGSQQGSRLPVLPPPDAPPPPPPAPEPAPAPEDPFGFGPAPGPKPFVTDTAFDLPPSEPVAPQPVEAPHAPAGSNPFMDFDEPPPPTPVPTPVPVPVLVPTPVVPAAAKESPDDEPPHQKKKRRDDNDGRDAKPSYAARTRPAEGGGGKNVLLLVLAGYALVATGLAVYGLFFKSGGDAADTGNPLSTIPDNFGEFDPVSRKKVTQLKFPVDGALPAAQRAGLGGTITVGQLQIQPKEVRKRKLSVETQGESERRVASAGTALVLILDIKNTSADLPIFPMDPAFTRREGVGAPAASRPITRLVVGDKVFAGGEIEWPLPPRVKKKFEVQQANDYLALKPGESREYVVFTAAKPEVVRAATAATEPLEWRVHVRRGLIEYKGKEVPVTAVIGIDFKASDIVG